MRIWTKLMKGDKLLKDNIYQLPLKYDINKLNLYLSEIAQALDIECPITLKKHYEHLYIFHTTTFTQDDFIDSIYFDKMICELISDKDNKKIK